MPVKDHVNAFRSTKTTFKPNCTLHSDVKTSQFRSREPCWTEWTSTRPWKFRAWSWAWGHSRKWICSKRRNCIWSPIRGKTRRLAAAYIRGRLTLATLAIHLEASTPNDRLLSNNAAICILKPAILRIYILLRFDNSLIALKIIFLGRAGPSLSTLSSPFISVWQGPTSWAQLMIASRMRRLPNSQDLSFSRSTKGRCRSLWRTDSSKNQPSEELSRRRRRNRRRLGP